MPIFLSDRQPDLVELMDLDNCDPVQLTNTYRQFSLINSLLSNWRKIYMRILAPNMKESPRQYSLLDIGFGGGDIPLLLSEWAEKDGINLHITAIETDKRAFDYVQTLPTNSRVQFKHCSSSDLVKNNEHFDFVISNHLLHHLNEELTSKIFDEAFQLANSMVLFNDIERSDIAYLLFNISSRLLFRNSFISNDGLTSIKRCYTYRELKAVAPDGWKVERSFPFRLLLTRTK